MLWGSWMQLRYTSSESFWLEKHTMIGHALCCRFLGPTRCQLACMPANLGPHNSWRLYLQQSITCRLPGFLKEGFEDWTCFSELECTTTRRGECAQEPLQFYRFRSAVKFWMVVSNSNTLRDNVVKADFPLGILVLLFVRFDRWRMPLVICRMALPGT